MKTHFRRGLAVLVLLALAAAVPATPAQELVRTGLTDLAANGSAFLAYPAGIGRSWNATTGCCATAAKQHVNDVAFLQVLLTAIEKHLPVDPTRVYIVGYSNGGRLALTAACAVPGIAGVATYGTTVGPATVTEWTSCRGDGRVALVRWDGLTHRWPGVGVVPVDAAGRALMWRFLTGRSI